MEELNEMSVTQLKSVIDEGNRFIRGLEKDVKKIESDLNRELKQLGMSSEDAARKGWSSEQIQNIKNAGSEASEMYLRHLEQTRGHLTNARDMQRQYKERYKELTGHEYGEETAAKDSNSSKNPAVGCLFVIIVVFVLLRLFGIL